MTTAVTSAVTNAVHGDVVVVGGGISGLTAAWALAGAGERVVVLESARQVGGKLQAASVAGISVDVGAEAMLARRPEGLALLAELGLTPMAPMTIAASLRVGGALRPLPPRTLLGIPTDLAATAGTGVLSEHALQRIAAEDSLTPLDPIVEDVTVGALVRSRLGNEVADRLVEPLLGGVYAGRADELSLRATMPALAAELSRGGSLVQAARTVLARAPVSAEPVFASLPGGLAGLPVALVAAGTFEVRTGVTVRSIARTTDGFVLSCGAGAEPLTFTADAVVVATPAAKAARLLREVAPAAATELAGIESASMAIVTMAFDEIALPTGSGLLVGAREGLAVKGVTLSSQKWPIDTVGHTVLRASVGRAGESQLLQRSDDELVDLVRRDLGVILGISAAPLDTLVTRWGGGLPQYALDHVERVARVRASVASVPGLAVCGAAFDGVGVPACIASARAAAAQVRASLTGGLGH